jgi:predicted helicase
LWEDVDHETKEARGLTRADTGIDVTDGATTIVQCKLRSRSVTWGECATFFGSAVAYADGIYSVPWTRLLLARNASSWMSPHLRALAESRPFDRPIEMSEVASFCTGLLSTTIVTDSTDSVATPARVLRDYQIEAIDLCCSETESAAYIVLPTGTGKNVIITESVRRVLAREGTRALVFVPTIALLEQQMEGLAGSSELLSVAAVAVGGGNTPSASAIRDARLVVCVYNSATRVDAEQFTCVFIDEAHLARPPALYADLRDDSSSVSDESTDEDSPVRCGYDAVREATLLPSARLLSATLDVPADAAALARPAARVTRGLREMIDAGYLRDYTLHVPVFAAGATDADLARHLVRTYRSMIVFCATRDEGRAFCAAMNALAPTAQSEAASAAPMAPMAARYIDCETPRAERREVLSAFKTGALAFIVNVRVLSVGFDAPITKGVCFLRIPASQTLAVQMIGRCLRPHSDKRIAHVVLPWVAAAAGGAGSDDEQHDTSAKKRVLALMRVMAHTDPRFARAMRERGGAYVSVTSERADDLEPDQPMPVESEQCALLHEAIYNSMGKALYGAWDANLAVVVAHYTLHGRMPNHTEPGGAWVHRQRQKTRDVVR